MNTREKAERILDENIIRIDNAVHIDDAREIAQAYLDQQDESFDDLAKRMLDAATKRGIKVKVDIKYPPESE